MCRFRTSERLFIPELVVSEPVIHLFFATVYVVYTRQSERLNRHLVPYVIIEKQHAKGLVRLSLVTL